MQFPILRFFFFVQCSSTHFTTVQYEGWLVKKKILPFHKKCCIKQYFFPSPSVGEDFFCHFRILPFTKVMALHSSLLYSEFLIHTLLLMPTRYPSFPEGIKTQSPWKQQCTSGMQLLSGTSLGLCSYSIRWRPLKFFLTLL